MEAESKIRAIILGAGEGTRMWPISTMVNKHLLKLGGKPVIRHIVDKLLEPRYTKGYDSFPYFYQKDITIICLKKDLKDYEWEFRDYRLFFDSQINFHVLEENTGTATEFYMALLKLKDDTVMLHYGDTITDLDYSNFIESFQRSERNAMIATTQNIRHDYSRVVTTGFSGLVAEIEEKPQLSFPSWTGIGIFKTDFIKNFIHQYLSEKPIDFAYHILPALVKANELYAYQYDGRWFDVGNLRSYQKLYKEYQNKDLNL